MGLWPSPCLGWGQRAIASLSLAVKWVPLVRLGRSLNSILSQPGHHNISSVVLVGVVERKD